MADALPGFGGSTLGKTLRAAGASFPIKARMHVYQAKAGTTASSALRHDRRASGIGLASVPHPLTPLAAGLLLKEPGLGAAVPGSYMRTPRRIAVGQRFYVLEPLGTTAGFGHSGNRSATARVMPDRAWISVNRDRAQITVGIYLSEAEAQRIAEIIRQGRGHSALLQALVSAYRATASNAPESAGRPVIAREEGEEFESFAAGAGNQLTQGFKTMLRRRVGAWVLPALAGWARNNAEAFIRAVAHPDAGVTVRVKLSAVPGLNMIGARPMSQSGSTADNPLTALRGTPAIAITVTPGKRRP